MDQFAQDFGILFDIVLGEVLALEAVTLVVLKCLNPRSVDLGADLIRFRNNA